MGHLHSKGSGDTPYPVGSYVSVLDEFRSNRSGETTYRWRKCKVKDVKGENMWVHFEGWPAKWDTVVRLDSNGKRKVKGYNEVDLEQGYVLSDGVSARPNFGLGIQILPEWWEPEYSAKPVDSVDLLFGAGKKLEGAANTDTDDYDSVTNALDAFMGEDVGATDEIQPMKTLREILKKERDATGVAEKKIGLCGLRNLGDGCFMNAVWQLLAHIPSVAEYFLLGKHFQDMDMTNVVKTKKSKTTISLLFAELLHDIWFRSVGTFVRPEKIRAILSEESKKYHNNEPGDSYEFLTFMFKTFLQELDLNCLNRTKKLDTLEFPSTGDLVQQADKWWSYFIDQDCNAVTKPFLGQLITTTTCVKCQNKTYAFDPFYDLPVEVTWGENTTLIAMLDQFSRVEKIETGDQFYCPTCDVCVRDITRECKIFRLPTVLLILLKRYRIDGQQTYKNDFEVDFPVTGLDLGPYMHEKAPKPEQTPIFDLISCINHYGTMRSGHYNCDVLHFPTMKWHRFDDYNVTQINMKKISPVHAYILTYMNHRVFYDMTKELRPVEKDNTDKNASEKPKSKSLAVERRPSLRMEERDGKRPSHH